MAASRCVRSPSRWAAARLRFTITPSCLASRRKLAPLGKPFERYLRAQHKLGWSDSEIAAGWAEKYPGCEPVWRRTVGNYRRRLGLCDNALSEHRRDRVRQKTREQLAAAGLTSMAQLRVEAWKKRAPKRAGLKA